MCHLNSSSQCVFTKCHSETQRQAQGQLSRKWLSWNSNSHLSDSFHKVNAFFLKEEISKITEDDLPILWKCKLRSEG